MKFLDGETLAARIRRAGRLSAEETLVIARQIASPLDAAHALGIIHGDMKRASIILEPARENSLQPPRAVIMDFGLARTDPSVSAARHGDLSQTSHSHRPVGTPAYMAPEQIDGRRVSTATDIYAFGLILFEMISDVRAFRSGNLLTGVAQRLTGTPPSPRLWVPEVEDSFEQAVQGCRRIAPDERFSSAAAAVECLEGRV
jgi:serine/threonine protein kinase